jgi:hypothetical protein
MFMGGVEFVSEQYGVPFIAAGREKLSFLFKTKILTFFRRPEKAIHSGAHDGVKAVLNISTI